MTKFTAALIFIYATLVTVWYFVYKTLTEKKVQNLESLSPEAQLKQNPSLYKNTESLARWGLEIDKDGKYQRIYNVEYDELYSDDTTETFTNH